MDDFNIIPSFTVEGTEVTLARSKKTRLQVALVAAEGPMVNLYATVVSKICCLRIFLSQNLTT